MKNLAVFLLFVHVGVLLAQPTGYEGYNSGYGGEEYNGGGDAVGAGGHKNHGHRHNNHGHNNHGDVYGDEHSSKDYYRGQQDKRKDFSNRDRAVANANHNRQVGDSYRNHGKVDDGFHNVYHKEEYSKNNRFFDTDRDNQFRQNLYDNGHFYGDVDGKYYDDTEHGRGIEESVGRRGNNYGRQYYDHDQGEYGGKDYEKDHQGYGQHGHQHQGYGHGHGHHGYY